MKRIFLLLGFVSALIWIAIAATPPPPPIAANPFSTNRPVNPITNSSPIYHLAFLQVEISPTGQTITNFWGNSIDILQLVPGPMQFTQLAGLEDSIIGVDSNGVVKKINAADFSNNTNTIVSQLGPFTPLSMPVADGTNTLTDGPFFVSAIANPNAWISGFVIFQGFTDGTDYSRLMIGHNGTNGAAVFNSTATGIAGASRGFEFQSNGVTVASIAANSGYEGSGLKFLSDDGTYQTPSGTTAGANPTAQVGLTVVNGVATTFMRSDAAPPLESVGTPGTYGDASNFPVVTTDAAGRVITVTTNSISAGQTNVSAANPTASVALTAVNGTATTFMRSDAAPPLDQSIAPTWTGLHDYTQNARAIMSVGDTAFVDFNRATQTNAVAGPFALTHATNGAHLAQSTHMRILLNSSGSDQTLSFPIAAAKADGWLTNQLTGAVPPAITNNTMMVLMLRCVGPTGTLAQQTNVMVLGFEYY